ncbi:MAG TPA: methionyl-tRNA formyltransferase [Vicinamibacterales bacterium]|jgi:methionyl-tRNA formyltransferase
MPRRIVFFGTPAFAVPSLSALIDSTDSVVAVVTQPDRPRGRGQQVRPEAVKIHAQARGVDILQPGRLRDEAFLSAFRSLKADLAVVAAYGRILPSALLEMPSQGFVNVHASLLPRWRGAAPVHRAIMAGDVRTGVTIMRVVPELDAGPMLASSTVDIGLDETSAELEARLASLGAGLLVSTLAQLSAGPVPETPQDADLVTYAPRLERRESRIDFARPAAAVHNQIRGLQPWPLAAALLRGKRVMFHRSHIISDIERDGEPGEITAVDAEGLVVATQPGVIRVLELQAEGKQPVPAAAFARGFHLTAGARFESLTET